MLQTVPLRRMRHGNAFRAASLRLPENLQSPFIGVDHAWMSGPVFPPHQHTSLSAVSYVFLDSETGIRNKDNIGTNNLIAPGSIHWTAAGRGIVHEEVPAESGKTVHSLQIFVALPEYKKEMPPAALTLNATDVPVINVGGCRVRIPVGSFGGVSSSLTPPTDVTILDLSLDENAIIDLPLLPGHVAFILPVFGDVLINGQQINYNDLRAPVFPSQETISNISIKSMVENGKVMFFSGLPLYMQTEE